MGLDHVRLPVAEERLWSAAGEIDREMFALLDAKITAAIRAGLRVILCLHSLRSHPSGPTAEGSLSLFREEKDVERFCRYWRDLARHFGGHSRRHLAYELLNEAVAPTDEAWNRVWRLACAAIRELEPERMLLVGSNHFQIPGKVKRLGLSAHDHNILPTFHLYYPILFTHYRADWLPGRSYQGAVQYPGRPVPLDECDKLDGPLRHYVEENNQPMTRQLLRAIVIDAVKAGRASGHVVHCGEFGCMDTLPLAARDRWYRDVVELFEEQGVPWTCWDWKGNLGILNRRTWQASGVHVSMGLTTPRRGRVPLPRAAFWIRVRRRLKRIAGRLRRLRSNG